MKILKWLFTPKFNRTDVVVMTIALVMMTSTRISWWFMLIFVPWIGISGIIERELKTREESK
jgi:hypothetical protein